MYQLLIQPAETKEIRATMILYISQIEQNNSRVEKIEPDEYVNDFRSLSSRVSAISRQSRAIIKDFLG